MTQFVILAAAIVAILLLAVVPFIISLFDRIRLLEDQHVDSRSIALDARDRVTALETGAWLEVYGWRRQPTGEWADPVTGKNFQRLEAHQRQIGRLQRDELRQQEAARLSNFKAPL